MIIFLEISLGEKTFLDRGAKITITLANEQYMRYLPLHRNMETLGKIIATISGMFLNLLLMKRYKKLVEDYNTDTENEEILLSYLHRQEEKEEAPERK